ncbi:disulfide bond formation protein DsbB [Lacimicrobium alkaliphilum]|uniref:Disulfide bond formation protein B n=1 Tax=Lacimicrobium alkaliphilum TaxID=1526571 RepID=A0ABQ1RGQ3_9ALTE|nr:disulfide bond formation protein DsbB [Lacimicrobium alkaliphilum]GGD67816.1 disulfide bond formation protein B [Lacimicrobium alkaliphilum]
MKSFSYLKQISRSRSAWALLLLSALLLEAIALYFQYGMGLEPCIMCIYQRNAVFGIALAAMIGLSMPDKILIRWIAIIGWGISSIWGLLIAIEHVEIQTAANPFFASCEIVPNFPGWLPLHEWMPAIFAATGDCGNIDWSFFGMSMPQWMIITFAVYSLIWLSVLLSQFKKTR